LYFLLLVFLAVSTAMATTVTFGSDLASEFNNVTGGNVCLVPVSAWAVPPPGVCWISFSNTGQGGWSPPNTVHGVPTAFFTEVITLPYAYNVGGGELFVDDTADIYLYNSRYPGGLMLWDAPTTPDAHCIVGKPGCEPWEGLTLLLDSTQWAQGQNRLVLAAYQYWGDGFGVMYRGEVESTPEPSTWVLGALGLLAIVVFRKLKHRRQ
jgi:hypothetical protein